MAGPLTWEPGEEEPDAGFGEAGALTPAPGPSALASRHLLHPLGEARGWENPPRAPTQPVGCSWPLRPRPPGGASRCGHSGEARVYVEVWVLPVSPRLLVWQARGNEGVRLLGCLLLLLPNPLREGEGRRGKRRGGEGQKAGSLDALSAPIQGPHSLVWVLTPEETGRQDAGNGSVRARLLRARVLKQA